MTNGSDNRESQEIKCARMMVRGDLSDVKVEMILSQYELFKAISEPEEFEKEEPDWNNLLGIAYNNPSTKYFDDEKSHNYFLKAAEGGSGPAAYNLAVRWLHGVYGSIDVERAQNWFARAVELGHGCAGATLSAMLMKDPLYMQEEGKEFTRNVNDILMLSEDMGGPWAFFYTAALHSSGRLGKRDPDAAFDRYMRLTGDEICGPPKALSVQALALHFHLGFLMEEPSPELALEIMERFPHDETQANIRHGAANNLARLKHIITSEIMPHREKERRQKKNKLTLPPDHQAAQELVSGVYFGTISFLETWNGLRAGTIPATQPLADRLWAASRLSDLENDAFEECWGLLRYIVEARLLGVHEFKVEQSRRDFGLQYNRVTPRGDPIPGEFINVPAEGFGKFRGLRCRDGMMEFILDPPAKGVAPLVLWEDLYVILQLAFGDPKGVVWPSVSVENLDKAHPDRPRWMVSKKIWEPGWLGSTQLGKTYYAADYWIGELAWNSKSIKTDSISDPNRKAKAETLLSAFAKCGGREDGLSARVMLRPEKVNWTWDPIKGYPLACDIHRIKMRVDGSETRMEPDGTENRLLNLNDSNFATGRIANLLTERYDDIAELWPMYERLRQLNGLVLAIFESQRQGFRLQPLGLEETAKFVRPHMMRPAATLAETLVL